MTSGEHQMRRMGEHSGVETLREAARLMRERARGATAGRWIQNGFEYDDESDAFTYDVSAASDPVVSLLYTDGKGNAEHIASWHPAVALAVADLLDEHVDRIEQTGFVGHVHTALETVARAYLGESA